VRWATDSEQLRNRRPCEPRSRPNRPRKTPYPPRDAHGRYMKP
jgi:hypothetical protein